MRRKRAVAGASARSDGDGTRPAAGSVPPDEPPAGEADRAAHEGRSLDTTCTCGHTRRRHTGLRIAVDGRCLECSCERFEEARDVASADAIVERLRVAIAQVERLRMLVHGLP